MWKMQMLHQREKNRLWHRQCLTKMLASMTGKKFQPNPFNRQEHQLSLLELYLVIQHKIKIQQVKI